MAKPHFPQRGFTLVEMIIVMVILGIISAILAVFIRSPVEGYVASVRRGELVDVADTALRRIGRDLRRSVPNSVRVTGTCGAGASCYLEFLASTSGGRYRAAGEGTTLCAAGAPTLYDALHFTPDTDTCFEILGPQITFTAGDQIVVANWGNAGSNAYEGNTAATHDRRAYAGSTGAQSKVVMTSANPLPLESPSKRFQVIAGIEQAVTYACEGIGALNAKGDGIGTVTRYWHYGMDNVVQPTTFAGGSSARIADNVSSCNIVYGSLAATNPYTRNGIVAIVLGITRSNETVNLYHEIHVDNLP